MNKNKVITLAVYTLCFLGSLAYLFVFAKETAFCGAPAMMLTMPWSLILTLLVNSVSQEIFDSSILPGVVLLVISFFLNVGCIVFFIKNKTSNKSAQDNPCNPPENPRTT